jgi:phospholipid/cholesterol/gamma-HCH transport system substrate-binding protein
VNTTSRSLAAKLATVASLGALTLAASGCLIPGVSSTPSISVSATFSDVSDLVTGAPVQYADVTVGSVSSITLVNGSQAKVVMSIDRSADVPSDVQADVAQATILGEVVVELVRMPEPASVHATLLADGSTISHTLAVPGVEQLVQAGTQALGAVSASELEGLIQAGAQGFGGQGETLHRLLGDLNTVAGAYASRSKEITSLISSLHQLGSSLAPNASANADAIGNLAKATTVLAQNADQFEQALDALNKLSVQGRGILENYLPGLDLQLEGLDRVTAALADRQQDLGLLLQYLPVHDSVLHSVVVNKFIQIVNDLIVCGLPGGGATNANVVDSCSPGGG